jgi:MFS family permease
MIGSGFGAAARSFLTSLVPRHETALLYTMFSLFASLGTLFGAPSLSYAFSFGIRVGGWLLGLPFFIAALLYLLCAGIVWSIRAPEWHNSTPEEEVL